MQDLDPIVERIKTEASLAKSGDDNGRNQLWNDLHSLSANDRSTVANKLEDGGNRLTGGVFVERDVSGDVRSITFMPSLRERAQAWISGSNEHSVRFTSPVTQNYNASDETYKRLRKEFERLPIDIRQLVVGEHYTIVSGDTVKKVASETQSNSLRSRAGASFEAIGLSSITMSAERRIVVPEKVQGADGKFTANIELEGAIRYQVGFLVDTALGALSDDDAFKKLVADELALAPPDVRQRLQVYVGPKHDSEQRMFARLFSLITRQSNEELSQGDKEALIYLKRSERFVRRQLGNYLGGEQQQLTGALDRRLSAQYYPPPDTDGSLNTLTKRVEGEIARAQAGSDSDLDRARQELDGLSWQERKVVAGILAAEIGRSNDPKSSGAVVKQDVIGNVRDMLFVPASDHNESEQLRPIRFPSPLVENYYASDELFQKVSREVDNLPPKIKTMLQDNEWVIATARSVSLGVPDCEGSCDDAAGITFSDQKRLVIPEYDLVAGRFWQKNGIIEEATRHEVGHAIDHMLHNISHIKEFAAAYAEDLATVPQTERIPIAYYIQNGWRGPEEMFAEQFSIITRRSDDHHETSKRDRIIHKYFTRSEKIIREHLGDVLDRGDSLDLKKTVGPVQSR